eukprot:3005931-Heterocapsa_arctica.AAC.1
MLENNKDKIFQTQEEAETIRINKKRRWTNKSKNNNRYMNMYMVDCCTEMESMNSTRTSKGHNNKLNNQ